MRPAQIKGNLHEIRLNVFISQEVGGKSHEYDTTGSSEHKSIKRQKLKHVLELKMFCSS